LKAPILYLTCGLLVLGVAESLAANGCDIAGQSSPGDWRADVSSSEKAEYLLDMELAASFMNVEACLTSAAQQSQQENASTEVAFIDASDSQDEALASPAEVASSGVEPSSAVESDNVMIPTGNGTTKADLERDLVQRNNTVQDDPSESGDLPASEDRLAAILIEAIRSESDPARRNALKERYKQLYGENANLD
tara:strand:+ start:11084 stop:11665 length:582 start_codon:yes stop_codon:yes gene_type:complete